MIYVVNTLVQLLRHSGDSVPGLRIDDHPDYPARGIMLDISRDRVMSLETLYPLVERLAEWKFNQLQLYMEHSFAYRAHPTVWQHASPFTAQEILELDQFCRQRHILLVPNQNSLGHMERWLKHPEYQDLAECPGGFIGDFGDHAGERRPATSLNPIDPRSLELIAGLYDDLLPNFSAPIVNVGGDEPWELGQCRSAEACAEHGRGRVYVDHLLGLGRLAAQRGRRMMFWADVITKYPELISEMPGDAIALEWGYYEGHPYADHAPLFAQSGLEFYVCPGTSSWNTVAGRSSNAVGNLRDAARTGLDHGASGLLITDWGDRGHWQPLPVSYLGYAYGLALAWAYDANVDLDIPAALDTFAFEDRAGVMGRIAWELGDLYRLPGLEYPNGSLLFFLLQLAEPDLRAFIRNLDTGVVLDKPFGIIPQTMHEVIERIDGLTPLLSAARMARPDADLIRAEYGQVAALLRHACRRGLALSGDASITPAALLDELEDLLPVQRLNWLARSRPGGLRDSLKRFEPVLGEYRSLTGDRPSYL